MAEAIALKVHPRDDLVVALRDLTKGTDVPVNGETIRLVEDVRAKHQFATRDVAPGERVYMHGVQVGEVLQPVARGAVFTVRNLKHASHAYSGRRSPAPWTPPDVSPWQGATFDGYHRPDGSVGAANHWIVLPLVFCENRNLNALREALTRALGYATTGPYERLAHRLVDRYLQGDAEEALRAITLAEATEDDDPAGRLFPNVDGVKFLAHTGGCGGTRDDARALCGLLAGYINHPNVAGATVLSLGCQNAQVALLQEELHRRNPDFAKPLHVYEQQQSLSEQAMLTEAIRDIFLGLAEANRQPRAPAPLDKLVIGMECGGSDAFSGISANPVMGQVADVLVALGGGVLLSEFPELCGVEQQLIDRCVDDATAARFVDLMRAYAARAEAVGSSFDMNPSPGNIRDGLITDAIKSAGAARKGGTSPVVEVLDYPEWVRAPGLHLLCTPGNDVESTTALAGAGANLILFSTGLGTPTGNPVTPVLKIASNTNTATRLADIIDFDAGPVIEGRRSIPDLGRDLFDLCLQTASGQYTPKAVRLGQDDFIPWKRGVSL